MVDAIVAHARADHPDEACGIIAGPAGSDRPTRMVPMTNAERSPTFYRFDSAGAAAAVQGDGRARTRRSSWSTTRTPATEAYPSRTDISYAGEPQAHYVLVSTREPDTEEFRSYRIVDGVVTEEPVEIIPAGGDVADHGAAPASTAAVGNR